MISRLGLLEIDCDAPPYEIVQSSEQAGLRSPLDVRWCRISHSLNERVDWRQSLGSFGRRILRVIGWPQVSGCICRDKLPALETFKFTFFGMSAGEFLLGQCSRCGTVFWEQLSWPDDQ